MWRILVAIFRLPLTILVVPWFILCTLIILLTIPVILPVWLFTLPFVALAALILNDKRMLAGHLAMPNDNAASCMAEIGALWRKFWRIASGERLGDSP